MGRSPIASIPKAVALCGLLAVGSPPARSDEPPAAKRPNVLFIAVDDLNPWVGYTGANPQTRQGRTPRQDRAAEQDLVGQSVTHELDDHILIRLEWRGGSDEESTGWGLGLVGLHEVLAPVKASLQDIH